MQGAKTNKLNLISKNSKDICLLITGCIDPNKAQPFLLLNDVQERLNQYIDCITYYIRCSPFSKIVYCDNSNFTYKNIEKLYIIAEEYGKSFEWISFQGDNEKVIQCTKGYGEGEIIEYALFNSKLMKERKAFFKITGRLKVLNINCIFRNIKIENSNRFNRDIYSGRRGIDTRFYCVKIEFYKNTLLEVCKELNVNRSLENAFYDALKGKKYKCLPAFPEIEGISGGNGRNYGLESKIKVGFFSLLCKFNIFNFMFPLYIGYRKIILCLKGQN